MSTGALLLIILVVLFLAGLPNWSYSKDWGPGPSGFFGFLFVILLVLWLMGKL